MINTGINQVSALLNANYEFMRSNIYAKELMDKTMIEVIMIANAEGVDLSEEDLARWYKILNSLGAEGKTSMCQDTEAKRKTEVQMLSGKMIELGEKHNIDVTINKVLYNLIKAKESL
jgi:2-dehydropantoate 2-reductase